VATRSLSGLTNSALIETAFLNAMGRMPNADEKRDWGDNLTAGRLTAAQFVAALAISAEHQAVGNLHNGLTILPLLNVMGTAAAETLNGTASSETLTGGLGADTINDIGGNDVYVWKKGDGNDIIYDQSASLTQTDTLKFLDVLPSEVSLSHNSGGSDLYIKVGLETITMTNRYYTPTTGYGVEQIQFSDGIIWTLDRILTESKLVGTLAAETIAATNMKDTIDGLAGNDTIYAYAGDDIAKGGLGDDYISDSAGNDTFLWAKGDGNDTIYDYSADKNEIDTLHLTNVFQSEVTLIRAASDLRIGIVGGEFITITNRFHSNLVGYGIEQIKFADGSIWSFNDILAKTITQGTAGADLESYSYFDDVIYGYDGNDSPDGSFGNDRIIGGKGDDSITDASGNETYVWSKGDGNDTIYDNSASLIEVDTLELTDVSSTEVVLINTSNSYNLSVKIAGETITLTNQLYSPAYGYGVERINFADGVIWNLNDILEHTSLSGTSLGETIHGRDSADNILGYAGDDIINSYDGNDLVVGGQGNDIINDRAGNDTYRWSTGDGSDTIYDSGASLEETDTLFFTDTNSTAVTLGKSGSNLTLTVAGATPQTITITNRFYADTTGYGVEFIQFADGVVKEVLASAAATISTMGTATANTISGWAFIDIINGAGGNDTINSGAGDDVVEGGQGIDTINDAVGNDTYIWEKADGSTVTSDVIYDSSASLTEIDTLVLTDVLSTDLRITRDNGSLDGKFTIVSTQETVLFTNQFWSSGATVRGYGVERIEFADGVVWTQSDIDSQMAVNGTAGADSLSGTAHNENFYGFAGNDTIDGGYGDDRIEGGLGVDTLNDGAGNDTFVWAKGDGNDIIYDSSASLTEVDTLEFKNVNSSEVVLINTNNNYDLNISVGLEMIKLTNQLYDPGVGYGIGRMVFADGLVWNLNQILEHTSLKGTAASDVLYGRDFSDNIYGFAGDDTINSYNGNDVVFGGQGNDTINDRAGNDTFVWTKGDGNDTVNDTSALTTDTDTLQLTDVMSTDVDLTRIQGSYDGKLLILSTEAIITLTNQFYASGATTYGYGVERIQFSDGVVWSKSDLAAKMSVRGTAAVDSLTGTAHDENFFGLDGADTIDGGYGDDRLVGGPGIDSLNDGSGNDTYVWTKGDGNDIIYDSSSLTTETDTLLLSNVTSTDLQLTRTQGSLDGKLQVISTGAIITLTNQFYSSGATTYGYGMERIQFSDGVVWTKAEILAKMAVNGTAAIDSLTGTAHNENFFGLAGNDTIDGGYGDDRIDGGAGADTINGSFGVDTMSYLTAAQAVTVNLALTTAQIGTVGADQVGDIISNVENIEGSAFADTLTGNASVNIIWGGLGNDRIDGGAGNDMLYGGDGNDFFDVSTGQDTFDGGAGIDALYYYTSTAGVTVDLSTNMVSRGEAQGDIISGIETVYGSFAGDSILTGDANDNILYAYGALNKVYGGAGNDTVLSGSGADILDGGADVDILHYYNSVLGVTVSLAANSAAGGDATGDQISGFENVYGSNTGADNITGDSNNNSIWGFGGDDIIGGGAGNDVLYGLDGNDWFYADTGLDTFYGGIGSDTVTYIASTVGVNVNLITGVVFGGEAQGDTIAEIESIYGSATGSDNLVGDANNNYFGGFGGVDNISGGLGDDTIDGGDGGDTLDGGGGTDILYYHRSVAGVNVNLATGDVSGGEALNDIISNFESVNGSNTGADTIIGDAQANSLWGYGGNDSITGAQGNDYLSGGAGVDTFVFQSGFGKDTVADFSAGAGIADLIQLSFGTAFDTFVEVYAVAAQVGADTVITFDANNRITLTGVTKASLVADDFAFV
jgi:Ca2+-binding RTX toxin-like protein